MRPIRAGLIVSACVAALLCAAGSAQGDEVPPIGPKGMLLAGNAGWLWIVRNTPGSEGEPNTFVVAARQAGKKWGMVTKKPIEARVVAAAAIDGQLHVICRRGAYLTFRQDDNDHEGAQRSLESGPLVVAPAPGFGPGGKTVLLAVADARVVPGACARFQRGQATRPAPATRPATVASRPTSLKSIIGLLVLTYSGQSNADKPWRPIALLEGTMVAPEGRVMTAALERRVYVLVANAPSGSNHLMAWTNGQWREVALTGVAADARALGMSVVGDQLVLLLAVPADGEKAGRKLSLAVFADDEVDKCEYHPVKVEGEQVARTWSAQSLPAFTGFGDQSAMLWQAGETLKFATCSPVGTLEGTSDVTVFKDVGKSGGAETIYVYVMCGFALATAAIWFSRRPTGPIEPFQLPAGTRPAQMPRRIMAAALDLLPFSLAATILFFPSDLLAELQASQVTVSEIWARLKEYSTQTPVPNGIIHSQILSIGLYTLYATVMELRFGQTLGKKLFKLRIVGHAGAMPAGSQIVLRNLARAVVLFLGDMMILPLLLVIVPLMNRNRQRMGDMLARTAVIDARVVPLPPEAHSDAEDDRIRTYTEHLPPDDDEEDSEGSSPP